MNGVFGEVLGATFSPGFPGLRGREAPGRMLWEMPAHGVHHSARGGTDPDAEWGQVEVKTVPSDHRLLPTWGSFHRERGVSFESMMTSFHTHF